MTIQTVGDLRTHVALAVRVELSTIPPYLTALYSIQDQASPAARLIASVAVEEMLHVCTASNLLLALGGEPDFSIAAMPRYPSPLPHHQPPLELRLEACSIDVIRNRFLQIERPAAPGSPPEDDEYHSLGQFYSAIAQSIEILSATENLFAEPRVDRQLSDPSFYRAVQFDDPDSGGLVQIADVASACAAIDVIVHQGEGVSAEKWADVSHRELTHYAKFEQLADGRIDLGSVLPVRPDLIVRDLPESIRPVAELANACYTMLFHTMASLFSGERPQGPLIGVLYALMSDCLAPTARLLVHHELGDGTVAGPTFEPFEFARSPWIETEQLAQSLAEDFSALEPVAERLIDLCDIATASGASA